MRVGVIGGGLMGSGIAEVCARSGVDVTVVEADDERAERSRAAIEKSLARAVRSGKLDDDSGGITVNTVTPGYTWTEMVSAVPEKVLDKLKGQIPLRRFGRPEEVARIVGFLAADESSYITGQVWGVNGGMDM